MSLRKYLTIKHHVPGRIRIKFGLGLLADSNAHALKEKNQDRDRPDCIHSVKVNMFTRNITIEYDPDVVGPKLLQEILTTEDEVRFNELAAELESATKSNILT